MLCSKLSSLQGFPCKLALGSVYSIPECVCPRNDPAPIPLSELNWSRPGSLSGSRGNKLLCNRKASESLLLWKVSRQQQCWMQDGLLHLLDLPEPPQQLLRKKGVVHICLSFFSWLNVRLRFELIKSTILWVAAFLCGPRSLES